MRPLVSYYGGKQRIVSQILPHIRQISHTIFVETHCGGASVFFAKDPPKVTNNDHYREVINDKDERIITMYRVAREQPEELARRLNLTLYSKAEHELSMQILRSPENHSDMDRAWAYYVNANCSFANKINGGWGRNVVSQNTAVTWSNKLLELPGKLKRLKDAYIENLDELECIKAWDSPQTLFYCDPPYPGTNQGHYSGYTADRWAALCAKLDSIQGSYILSGYGQDIEPESAIDRIEIDATCSASSAGKVGADRSRKATAAELGNRERTEILWICDRSHAARDDLQPILQRQKGPQQMDLFDDSEAA